MRRFIQCCSLTLLLLLLDGCATSARRLEVSAVRKIQVGVSKMSDVEKIFGPPLETMAGANQQTVARYFFRELHVSNDVSPYERREHPGDILLRTLSLRYGPAQVIDQKLHDESLTPIYRYNASYVSGPTVTPEALVSVRKNVTTSRELIELLGEPGSRTFDEDGTEMLVWFSVKVRRGRFPDAEVRSLTALINDKQLVKDYVVHTVDWPNASRWFR